MKKQLILGSLFALTGFGYSQTGILVTSGVASQSGLKFANFNDGSTLSPTSGKVLSVSTSGDVILVPDQGGSGTFGGAQNGCSVTNPNIVEFGNALGGNTAQLLSKRQVPQNNFGILFSGSQPNDLFQIGGNLFNNPARFSVEHHDGSLNS